MNNYDLKVTIDRPGAAMDVVLEQVNADFDEANVASAAKTLTDNFKDNASITSDTIIRVEAEYRNEQGGVLLAVNSPGATKLEIESFIGLINLATQTPPQQTGDPV